MKKTLLFLILFGLLSLSQTVNAQSPDWLWANSAGGTTVDRGESIATDLNGNVLVTGFYSSAAITFGSITLTNASASGTDDIFIVKYDASGTVLWAKSAGGISDDFGRSITTDKDGNVLVTGGFSSPTITFGNMTLTNAVFNDIFVVKYDGSGNLLWAKSAGGNGIENGQSITTDAIGNVLITGIFDSPSLTFGTTTISNEGNSNIFVVKYDPSGNVLWAKSEGGTGGEFAQSISTDMSGNILVTGSFNGVSLTIGSTTLSTAGVFDIFILKYDANGNVLWVKSAGGTSNEQGESIAADADGNVMITGFFSSPSIIFGNTTLTNTVTSGQGIFVVKYDVSGNVLWAKSAVGNSNNVGRGICALANGNILVAGLFASPLLTFGTTTLTNANNTGINTDIFVVEYDASGHVVWAKSAGSTGIERAHGIANDPNGNIFITGYFTGTTVKFGATTLTNSGSNDFFVAKLDATVVGIKETSLNNSVTVYPNPFRTSTTIKFNSVIDNGHLSICSVHGRLVKEIQNISAHTITINRDNLASGLYFLSLTDVRFWSFCAFNLFY